MYKKLAAALGVGTALTLGVVGVVSACGQYGCMTRFMGSSDYAFVRNSSYAGAYTGGNTQDGVVDVRGDHNDDTMVTGGGNRNMTTGNAYASSDAVVLANLHEYGCTMCDYGHRDHANVGNASDAMADTGVNHQDDMSMVRGDRNTDSEVAVGGSRTMNTGNARSYSHAWSVTNVHGYMGL